MIQHNVCGRNIEPDSNFVQIKKYLWKGYFHPLGLQIYIKWSIFSINFILLFFIDSYDKSFQTCNSWVLHVVHFMQPYGTLLKFCRSPSRIRSDWYLHHPVFGDCITGWIQLNGNILKVENDDWSTKINYLGIVKCKRFMHYINTLSVYWKFFWGN